MALHTKKQFCELCKFAPRELSVYKKRGKVIIENDFIDDTNPINQEFIFKRQQQLEKSNQVSPVVPELKVIQSPPPQNKIKKTISVGDLETQLSWKELDSAKKSLDIEKITEEIEILKVKKDKLHGAVIPTEIVKIIFGQQFKSITAAFHNGADNYLVELAKLKDLNREEMAIIRGKLIEIINKAVNDSVDESKKMIKNIVSEYSEKKDVGEKA